MTVGNDNSEPPGLIRHPLSIYKFAAVELPFSFPGCPEKDKHQTLNAQCGSMDDTVVP